MTTNLELTISKIARKVFQQCTEEELYIKCIAHQVGTITQETLGYSKVKALLTEDKDTRFHSLVFKCLDQTISETLD